MKSLRLLGFLMLSLLGTFLSLSTPAHADDDPALNQVRKDLEKAWNPAGDPPSIADRTALLKSAMELLKKLPPAYHGHRVKAMKFIDSALFELNKGDPDNKATDFIHQAVSEVRDIT